MANNGEAKLFGKLLARLKFSTATILHLYVSAEDAMNHLKKKFGRYCKSRKEEIMVGANVSIHLSLGK